MISSIPCYNNILDWKAFLHYNSLNTLTIYHSFDPIPNTLQMIQTGVLQVHSDILWCKTYQRQVWRYQRVVRGDNSKTTRQYNGQKKTDNTMVKRKQTIQWSKENRQYNGQKKTDNTMVKRKQTKRQWSTKIIHRKH